MHLPFDENPPIKTYQYAAYSLGVILGCGHETSDILYNNYIQLAAPLSPGEREHVISFLPVISPPTFPESGLGVTKSASPFSLPEFIEFIDSSLATGFFSYIFVDEFYIPSRVAYLNRHALHDTLVVGFDDHRENVTLMGYGIGRRYGKTICNVGSLYSAYGASARIGLKAPSILAFKFAPRIEVSLDLPSIRRQLSAFLSGSLDGISLCGIPKGELVRQYAFGIETYDVVRRHLINYELYGKLDRRAFSVLAEHARVMLARAKRVYEILGRASPENNGFECFYKASEAAGKLMLLSLRRSRMDAGVLRYMSQLCDQIKGYSALCCETLCAQLSRG